MIFKVGIVCDDYKVPKFKQELENNAFKEYEVTPFVSNTTIIQVKVDHERVDEFKRVIKEIELSFTRSN